MTRRECIARRMNRGLSTEAAAREMGIARKTLLRFENGDGVTLSSLKAIADFYGVKVTDLVPPSREDVAA